jgi:hypothetical protein
MTKPLRGVIEAPVDNVEDRHDVEEKYETPPDDFKAFLGSITDSKLIADEMDRYWYRAYEAVNCRYRYVTRRRVYTELRKYLDQEMARHALDPFHGRKWPTVLGACDKWIDDNTNTLADMGRSLGDPAS